eukprot:CAMPEP_0206019550 /NCGR_PEP_ID=MMETSP1464-20131121/29306_1 /ASSEMBLY_ACC=CAM_ASM_001124 /TAXON_ID=119497 /ORGANISM="Exanthemachrysis gayraliae, Strain RCC1523" /LENGTH=99 /DNA_ID=CAMNT_0053393453 /DNA_START=152 /DNA_END=449 /DNA_ORIENTATION=+
MAPAAPPQEQTPARERTSTTGAQRPASPPGQGPSLASHLDSLLAQGGHHVEVELEVLRAHGKELARRVVHEELDREEEAREHRAGAHTGEEARDARLGD